MTVVVAFLCTDGVVVGADSMLTPSMGGQGVGHHKGRKVGRIDGEQIFAFAGDQGLGARFQIMAAGSHALANQVGHPIDYALALTNSLTQQFHNSGATPSHVNAVVAFQHNGNSHCCMFEGAIQPRLLDEHHFYAALGSGKLSADPFLRYLADIFCPQGTMPTVRLATFLTAWTIQHVIETNPGGVAGPIRMATIEQTRGATIARDVPADEIDQHLQAMESAVQALRDWSQGLHNNGPQAREAEPPPVLGQA
ncbi:hypothetical protein [Brevundimonas sp. SGAir0440]|uniref:hypothetical protein n=1 Tax=Brevundimonas sp. SGAir0440 TaxID=2579977 RepID=UPI0010CD594E|nr:hypothetical protein [Brevundimonas sp. SGAir0440]QCQ99172.1 hypothetical protein E7T10_11065 [Brevundimonas sp. SGAir0440]